MKVTLRTLLPVFVAILLVGATSGVSLGQSQEPAEAPESQPAEVVTGLQAEGALRAVDPDESIFLIVGEDGSELLFHYNEDTEVVGEPDGVQGLTGQSDTWVRIDFRAEGTQAIAERIELSSQEPAAGEAEEAPESDEQPIP